jgi:hypothetical protein
LSRYRSQCLPRDRAQRPLRVSPHGVRTHNGPPSDSPPRGPAETFDSASRCSTSGGVVASVRGLRARVLARVHGHARLMVIRCQGAPVSRVRRLLSGPSTVRLPLRCTFARAAWRPALVKLRDGNYTCSICGAVLRLPANAQVRFSIHAASGRPNVRAIHVGDHEIHRCPIGPVKVQRLR